MNTPPVHFPESISKERINALPLAHYEGPITLVDTPEKAEEALAALRQETLLGFDTETRPSFRKGESFLPSLVQLAGADTVYLFQIKPLGTLEPLLPLFSDPHILKAGVALRDDIRSLQKVTPFTPRGFLEISDLTTPLGIINTGLRPLCALFLNVRISKKAQVSNWSRRDLSPAQIQYAATDAWIARSLYSKLEALGLTPPPAPIHAEKLPKAQKGSIL